MTESWVQEASRRAGIDLWPDPIEARQVVTADGSVLLVVGPLLVRTPETLDVEEPWAEAAMWAYQYTGALSTAYDFDEDDIVPLLDLLSALAESRIPPVEWPAVVPSIEGGTRGMFSGPPPQMAASPAPDPEAGLREAGDSHDDLVWEAALADPGFVAALHEGLADAMAGRTSPWSEVLARLRDAASPAPDPGAGDGS